MARLNVNAITTAVTDALYEKLPVADDGCERRTTINHAMKTCRRAWNVTARRNPFARMGLKSPDRETPTATWAELQTFRRKAIEMCLTSLATAALIAWEWLQRQADIFASFDVMHYRPKERPQARSPAARIIPLNLARHQREVDLARLRPCRPRPALAPVPLQHQPANVPALDAVKLGHQFGIERHPVVVEQRHPIFFAGLDVQTRTDELTFTSFRHGGFTEAADADLSDAEMRAAGRHKSAKLLPTYAKRTMKQVAEGARNRRAQRKAQ